MASKRLKYDLALEPSNVASMLEALTDIHPQIAAGLPATVGQAATPPAKAQALFIGMFERTQNNVQKGRFGQALAQTLAGHNSRRSEALRRRRRNIARASASALRRLRGPL